MTFLKQRVFAILRATDASRAAEVLDVVCETGMKTAEITITTGGAFDAIAAARERYGEDMWIGAGTVLDAGDAKRAIDAGAQFCVSPIVDESMIEACVERGVPAVPGAYTPTEMVRAARLGSAAVKVFPRLEGGPQSVGAILAPLPWLRLVPTGGVTIDAIGGYLEAGAAAVGLGAPLIGDALRGGSLDEFAGRVRAALRAATSQE